MTQMTAVITADGQLTDASVTVPDPGPRDLLVRVAAVSVNPVDTKVRPGRAGRILGYDAAGTVVAAGAEVTRFAVGDEVYYAGDITRPGSNAEFQAVDERITGRKPSSLSFADAASLPLTTITAWETLFDHLGAGPESAGDFLIVGAPGGVGSILTQLARTQTRLRVIGTAGRAESAAWVRKMGAHETVDHHDLAAEVRRVAPRGVDWLFTSYSRGQIPVYAEVLRPFGHIVAIDDEHEDPIRPVTWTSRVPCSTAPRRSWTRASCGRPRRGGWRGSPPRRSPRRTGWRKAAASSARSSLPARPAMDELTCPCGLGDRYRDCCGRWLYVGPEDQG